MHLKILSSEFWQFLRYQKPNVLFSKNPFFTKFLPRGMNVPSHLFKVSKYFKVIILGVCSLTFSPLNCITPLLTHKEAKWRDILAAIRPMFLSETYNFCPFLTLSLVFGPHWLCPKCLGVQPAFRACICGHWYLQWWCPPGGGEDRTPHVFIRTAQDCCWFSLFCFEKWGLCTEMLFLWLLL